MKTMKWLVLLSLVGFMGSALAQPPPPPPPGEGPEGGPMREKIRERIQNMKIWRLTEAVELTPKQSEQFFPLYNKHQQVLEDLEAKRMDLVNKLEKLSVDSTASQKDIEQTINSLKDFPRQLSEENDRFMTSIEPILPLQQRAKLVVFEERFRQRLQDFIRDMRRQYRGDRMDDDK